LKESEIYKRGGERKRESERDRERKERWNI